MTHDKREIRTLTYQGYGWPVIHALAPEHDDQACYVCDDSEWELSDDDLIENLILQGVILHNNAGEYNEDEIYSVEVHNKGVVASTSAYFNDGLWFQQATNLPLVGRIVVKEYGRDEFMAYFRGDKARDDLTKEDRVEVFLCTLRKEDLDVYLLEELCHKHGLICGIKLGKA